MVYNMTTLWEANNIIEIIGAVNTASSDWLFSLLAITLFIVIILIFYRNNMKAIFLVDSFIMAIFGIICYTFGWVSSTVMLVVPFLLVGVGILLYLFID